MQKNGRIEPAVFCINCEKTKEQIMELTFVNAVKTIRGKWETVILQSRLPVSEDPDCPMMLCYQRGIEGMERYIREKLLPELENVSEGERRRYRLHRREIRLSYICMGELLDGRYWSIRLKCEGVGEREASESCRVWDAERGCLCPIDLFLHPGKARKYNRWEFALDGARVWAISKAKGEGEWIDRKRIDK